MQQPWMKCLQANGVPMTTGDNGLLDIDATGNSQESNGRIMAEAGYDFVKKDGEWLPGPTWADGSMPPNEALELGCQVKAYDGKRG